jgi:hypothetical protein
MTSRRECQSSGKDKLFTNHPQPRVEFCAAQIQEIPDFSRISPYRQTSRKKMSPDHFFVLKTWDDVVENPCRR